MSEVKPIRVFDVECYPNFFLVLLKDVHSGERHRFQISPNCRLDRSKLIGLLTTSLLIGFNSFEYDMPMIQLALRGYSAAELKEASDAIVTRGMRYKEFAQLYELSRPSWDHIDLIQVAPLKASLKLYAGRLHCKTLQDLPIDPDKTITADDAALLAQYCENDLDNTATLYRELKGQLDLRVALSQEYKADLRSKSDPQVAEAIICHEIKRINGVYPKRPEGVAAYHKYKVPECVNFRLPQLQELLETIRQAEFAVAYSGSIELPRELAAKDIVINGARYRIGIGGLHSNETKVAHVADDDTLLIDRDVASYYPAIILNQRLAPKHLGDAFLQVYEGIVSRRLAAKRAKDKMTAESLKIAVNGSFGKLGNKYSALYAPDLLIQVTLSGQLMLLMLIERIEQAGIQVVSANTDGIVMKCPASRYGELDAIVKEWERVTALTTEETRYKALYSKDVNNYIAIKTDGTWKGKGLYANPWSEEFDGPGVFKLQKNPSATIVNEAVVALLRDGTGLEDTIYNCEDVRKFISVRTVNGGAKQNDVYIGKVVRWYYSKGSHTVMNYRTSGYKVPKSDNSTPLMVLPDKLPADINHDWYAEEARDVLRQIGFGQPSLFN